MVKAETAASQSPLRDILARQESLNKSLLITRYALTHIAREVQSNPLNIRNPGGGDRETVLYPSYHEHLSSVYELLQPRDLSISLLGGLTRSGKTLSGTALVETINALGGHAVYFDLTELVSYAQMEKRSLGEFVIEQMQTESRNGVVHFAEFDELARVRQVLGKKGTIQFILKLQKAFPTTHLQFIDIFFRNRGKTQKKDISETPESIQKPVYEGLKMKGVAVERMYMRDAWMADSIIRVIQALSAPGIDPQVIEKTARELKALSIANPFIIKRILDEHLFKSYDPQEEEKSKFSEQTLSALHASLLIANKGIIGERNLISPWNIVRDAGVAMNFESLFETAFGGYDAGSIMLKLLAKSAEESEAGDDLNWRKRDVSLFGKKRGQ